MKFTVDQLEQFDKEGILFIPDLFDLSEVNILNSRLSTLLKNRSPKVLRERNSDSVRSVIAPHLEDEIFRRLSLHPRIIKPAQQILGGDVYLHQFKINAKEAHDGEIWHWHQDYRMWHEDDGMTEPDVINATIFLDEVSEFSGPMMFIPRSHKRGRIESDNDFERVPEYGRLSADAVGSPYKKETINAQIAEHGILAPKGGPGSTIFFHGCTLHGSGPNMSPWGRAMVFSSINKVENYIRKPTRPDFLALQDFTSLDPLKDDCLLKP